MDGITVRQLVERRAHLFHERAVIAGESGLDRLITNVNVMEVPDIHGQVRKGDLLLTTGFSIKDNINAQENLISGLADRHISAMGIKMRRYLQLLPQKMLDQADHYGIPLLDLSYNTNFSLVISEVLEEILREKSEAISQVHHDSQHLTNLLVMGATVATFVESLSVHLNRRVILVTREGERIGTQEGDTWPHQGQTTIAQYHTISGVHMLRQSLNGHRYLGYPVGHESDLQGHLLFEDTEATLSDSQIMLLQHAARLLSLKLGNLRDMSSAEERYREIFLRKWILGEISDRENVMVQAATVGLYLHESYAVILATLADGMKDHEQIRRALSDTHHGTLVAFIDHQVVILWPESTSCQGFVSTETSCMHKLQGTRLHFLRVGVSPFKRVEEMPSAYQQARDAAAIFAAIDPTRQFCFYDDLGVYTVLHQAAQHESMITTALSAIEPLLGADTKQRDDLINTLHCFVYENGNIRETSQRLYCHYNSVLYRLTRIEKFLGFSVRSTEGFFRVQFAMRLLEFLNVWKPRS